MLRSMSAQSAYAGTARRSLSSSPSASPAKVDWEIESARLKLILEQNPLPEGHPLSSKKPVPRAAELIRIDSRVLYSQLKGEHKLEQGHIDKLSKVGYVTTGLKPFAKKHEPDLPAFPPSDDPHSPPIYLGYRVGEFGGVKKAAAAMKITTHDLKRFMERKKPVAGNFLVKLKKEVDPDGTVKAHSKKDIKKRYKQMGLPPQPNELEEADDFEEGHTLFMEVFNETPDTVVQIAQKIATNSFSSMLSTIRRAKNKQRGLSETIVKLLRENGYDRDKKLKWYRGGKNISDMEAEKAEAQQPESATQPPQPRALAPSLKRNHTECVAAADASAAGAGLAKRLRHEQGSHNPGETSPLRMGGPANDFAFLMPVPIRGRSFEALNFGTSPSRNVRTIAETNWLPAIRSSGEREMSKDVTLAAQIFRLNLKRKDPAHALAMGYSQSFRLERGWVVPNQDLEPITQPIGGYNPVGRPHPDTFVTFHTRDTKMTAPYFEEYQAAAAMPGESYLYRHADRHGNPDDTFIFFDRDNNREYWVAKLQSE